jgi:hypothetical protein
MEMVNLALRGIFFPTSKGSFTCRKILRHGADGFTSPPREGVLRIFIALKNPSPSAGFEPANLESNIKHANHYATEDDLVTVTTESITRSLERLADSVN